MDYKKLIAYSSEHRARLWTFEKGREAAVLIPLIAGESGETSVLFEVRSDRLNTQPSEICFPGGGIEGEELPSETAVRETVEELIVKPEQVKLLCEIDGTIGPSGAPIWAFAGEISDYHMTFSKEEVNEVFLVPLSWLLNTEPEAYSFSYREIPDDKFLAESVPGGDNVGKRPWVKEVPVYRYKGHVIWGATARILKQFTQRIKEASNCRF